MLYCPPNELYRPKYAFLWMILSLKAGYLNAAGFLATGKFVSHVTGFGTQMGIFMTHENYEFGIELLIVPIAFILGSSIPAWILERNYSEDKLPKYYQVQFLITLTLFLLLMLGVGGTLGEFSTPTDDIHDIVLAGYLCFICGMKNGLTTWATYGRIRTTHLTGLATDIGLHLPKLIRNQQACRFPEPRRRNSMRILTFLSFSFGSLAAAFIFPKWEFEGLLIPLSLSVILSIVSFLNYRHFSQQKEFQ